jgi:hypothetical protein
MMLVLTGCAAGADSLPEAVSVSARTYNEGTEGSQYAEIEIGFADRIDIKKFKPEIKIAGEKVGDRALEIQLGSDGRSAVLRIASSKSRAADFSVAFGNQRIEGILPSGLALTEIARSPGSVAVEVAHGFNIRCIAWLHLMDNGEPVGGSLLAGADEKDGAVGVHGHEFLDYDNYAIAALIAETLAKHFSDRYSFTADGKAVIAASLGDPGADLSLEVYEYAVIS